MSEKPSVEKVSTEMGTLLGRIRELEHTLSRKLETTLKNTTRKLRGEPAMEAAAGTGPTAISNERRRRLIELTAYCKAERRGFAGGEPEQDWLDAEREVDRLLLSGQTFLEDADITTGMPPRQ